jgi:hypothetical protein
MAACAGEELDVFSGMEMKRNKRYLMKLPHNNNGGIEAVKAKINTRND